MTDALTPAGTFQVANKTVNGSHTFSILDPGHDEWLAVIAAAYRDLRTSTAFALDSIELNGITVLDVESLQRRLTQTQVPERNSAGSINFAVERADLGEVALAIAGEELRGYSYGYRGARDRELVNLPGRGIDQIGVRKVGDAGNQKIIVSLGEAKVSSEQKSPPSVVEGKSDSLWNQHSAHIRERESTCAKLWAASRRCTDLETQNLLQSAAALWENGQFDFLIIRCTSMLVRPQSASPSDFGRFAVKTAEFDPAELDFLVLRLGTDDIEAVVDEFLSKSRLEDDSS